METLLTEGRLLFVAPTGGGKSLVFQLPGLLLSGTTIVVCPLVSLMKDQVASLVRKGISATYLAATVDPEEQRERTANLVRGVYEFLYVAPERLSSPRFRALARDLECPLLAVDEAHCISEWGHDFRPDYLEIGAFVRTICPPKVIAVTATATPRVQDEIVERLGMGADTTRIVRGFARPNLSLRVRKIRDRAGRIRAVDAELARVFGDGSADRSGPQAAGAAVIYAPTRRLAEEEAVRISALGKWRCLAYHAGLPSDVRDRVQDAFCGGEIDVVVATNAFGMGIDRSDVRLVIHLGPPGSIESYYQEVGRGGRDGDPADGLLLLGPEEVALRRRFAEGSGSKETSEPKDSSEPKEPTTSNGPNRSKASTGPTQPPGSTEPVGAERRRALFHELMKWAMGRSCRHAGILRYFGETGDALTPCGQCDVCEANGGFGGRGGGRSRRLVRWLGGLVPRSRRNLS